MSVVLNQLEGEAIRLSPTFPLVLTPGGVVLTGLHGVNDLECTFPLLLLLERLARSQPAPLGAIIDEVAALTGTDPEELRTFSGHLILRSHVQPSVDAGVADPGSEVDRGPRPEGPRELDPTEPLVLPTPLILGLTAAGFEKRDHDDHLALRLSADRARGGQPVLRPHHDREGAQEPPQARR